MFANYFMYFLMLTSFLDVSTLYDTNFVAIIFLQIPHNHTCPPTYYSNNDGVDIETLDCRYSDTIKHARYIRGKCMCTQIDTDLF